MINTPTIDAALQKDQRVLERWENAKKTLDQSLAAQKIWNTEYEDVKHWLSRAAEIAKRPLYEELLEQRRTPGGGLGYASNAALDAINPWFNAGSVAKEYRELQKAFPNKGGKTGPVYSYMQILAELLEVLAVLKQLKPLIVKGRKPDPNAKPVDKTNMAECAICWREQKMDVNAKMVWHGYQISDGAGNYFGFRSGKCFGVGYKPYILSCQANKDFLIILQKQKKGSEAHLKDLKGGKITELTITKRVREGYGNWKDEYEKITPGHPGWQRAFEAEVNQVEWAIDSLERQIGWEKEKITKWKPGTVVLNGQTVAADDPGNTAPITLESSLFQPLAKAKN